jgi:hypothetical protein
MNLNEVNACFCRFQRTRKSAQTNTSGTPSPTCHSLYTVVSFTRKLEIAKEKSSKFAPSCGVGNSPARFFDANSGPLASREEGMIAFAERLANAKRKRDQLYFFLS